MAKRTIKVAFWRYQDSDGKHRLAWFGDEVDLPKHEVDRGNQAGVFTAPEPSEGVRPTDLEASLMNIEPRVSEPVGATESDAAPLHHDVTSTREDLPEGVVIREDGEDLPDDAQPTGLPALEPLSADQSADTSGPLLAAQDVERPKAAATVDVWRAWAKQVRPDLDVESMNKDELKAIEV